MCNKVKVISKKLMLVSIVLLIVVLDVTTAMSSETYYFISKWGVASSSYPFTPLAIAVDSSGNVFVTDTDNHRVQKFSNKPNSLMTNTICSSVTMVGSQFDCIILYANGMNATANDAILVVDFPSVPHCSRSTPTEYTVNANP
ncbi:secreted protein, partial [Candidatus Magnetobacterium bavaricum]